MNGWTGKILRVNLTTLSYFIDNLDPFVAKNFVGTRGLATKYLYDEIDPKIDAFSPDNKLIFAPGPLTGSGIIGSGRFMVLAKSPLTEGIGSANAGGYFGPEVKYAGYDMLIFEGKAPEPVYVYIENEKVFFKSAEHIWGKSTGETEKIIKNELKEANVMREIQICEIGPAGEKLSRIAIILHFNDHAAARNGLGAVMGSKNLKAVAIRGTKGVSIANKDQFLKLLMLQLDAVRKSSALERRPLYGTWTGISRAYKFGVMSTRNAQTGICEGTDGAEKVLREKFFVNSHTCACCPFMEMKTTKAYSEEYQSIGCGLEWETFDKLGPDCGITDLHAINHASHLCNEYGIDTISAGGTIACAMELSERGYIPENDIGYKLKFGDAKALIDLIHKIGKREGFGDILAEGGYRLAVKYGHPELFMGAKKMEFPGWHPQGFQVLALSYATGNRGACHLKNITYYDDSRFETKGQAAVCKADQDYVAVMESAGLCHSIYVRDFPVWKDLVPQLLEAVTGAGYDAKNTWLAGERIYNIERLFNLRAGLTGNDDTLPPRILNEPMPEGPSKGHVVKLNEMLPEYYELRGWDSNGVPKLEKMSELGLEVEYQKFLSGNQETKKLKTVKTKISG